MSLTLITPPSVEPISLAELKLQARIDGTGEDALLAIYIAAARQKCEAMLGRALITQTWDQTLDAFPDTCSPEIKLLKPGVQSITSVSYIDINGDTQTISSTDYALDAATSPGWLYPADEFEWPDTDDVINAVTIRYVAGFGADATFVPADIRAWLLMTAAMLYANREAMDATGRVGDLPSRFVDSLLDPHKVYGV